MFHRIVNFFVSLFEAFANFLFTLFIFTKVKPVKLNDKTYSLKPLVGPIVKGIPLRILVGILKLPVIGNLIINQLKQDNKFDDIIDFAAATPLQEPMPTPPKILPPDEWNLAATTTNEDFAHELYKRQLAAEDGTFFSLDESETIRQNKSVIRKLHGLFLAKKLTPLEYVKTCIENYKASNKHLKSFIFFENEATILQQAQESTDRFLQGRPHSILDGIPIGVKSCIPVKGFRNTIGSRLLNDPVLDEKITEAQEAETVRRLRRARAIILGLNNMHELGVGGSGANEFFGAAKNPHSHTLTRQSGGSSSGGAVALAAGIIPIALATCGGGSGRGPFGFNGVVGFKAGYQVVPTKAGLAYSIYHETPAATTVEDVRILFEILAQQSLVVPSNLLSSSSSSSSRGGNNINYKKQLPRIGIFREHANDCSPQMQQAYSKAEEKFRALGCEVVDTISIPNLHHAAVGLNIAIMTEIFGGLAHKRHLIGTHVDPAHQVLMLLANSLSANKIFAMQIARRWFVEHAVPEIFSQVDVILSPTTGTVAPPAVAEPHGEINLDQTSNFVRYLFFANFVGAPAISVPTGKVAVSDDGVTSNLPTSVHLMSNLGNESVLLEAAKLIEHGNPAALRPDTKWNYFPEYL